MICKAKVLKNPNKFGDFLDLYYLCTVKTNLTIGNDEKTVCQYPWANIVGVLWKLSAAESLYFGTYERR